MGNFSIYSLILLIISSLYLSGFTGCRIEGEKSEDAESAKKALAEARTKEKEAADKEKTTRFNLRNRINELAGEVSREEGDKKTEAQRVQQLRDEKSQLEAELAANKKAAKRLAKAQAEKLAAEQKAQKATADAAQAEADAQAKVDE